MASGVYEIVNVQNGIRYVGSTSNLEKRKIDHFAGLRHGRHENAYLQHEWNKYGKNAFEFSVVVECPPTDMITREQERIDLYDFESLYNLSPTAGSQKGRKHTPEARQKMMGNQNALGSVRSAETRAKISAAKSNPSPETRTKISTAGMGRVVSAETRSKMSAARMGNQNALGYTHSEDARAKMSAERRGRVVSMEARAKKSAALMGHTVSAETRAKISAAKKKMAAEKREVTK